MCRDEWRTVTIYLWTNWTRVTEEKAKSSKKLKIAIICIVKYIICILTA